MARGNGKEHQQRRPDRENYRGVRQGGTGTYEALVIAKRRARARVMARNNTLETEAINEESTRAVVDVLSRKDLFPWIESVELEEDRLGDDDWVRKTDAYANIALELGRFGLLDQYRIQIKSGWSDLSGLETRISKITFPDQQRMAGVGLGNFVWTGDHGGDCRQFL